MEFSPRGWQRNNTPRQSSNPTVVGGDSDGSAPNNNDKNDKKSPLKLGVDRLKDGKFPGTLAIVLFVSILVLFIAIILGISSFSNREIRVVDEENYQAVVLSDGQAYFGKITRFHTDFLILVDVFYVQGQQLGQNQPQQAASLRKLGCEIHGPQDHMVIYRSQVMYWENLKSDGRVPQLIEQFKDENPNGQTCSTQTPTGSQNDSEGQQDQENESGAGANSPQQNDESNNEPTTQPPANNPNEPADDSESQD